MYILEAIMIVVGVILTVFWAIEPIIILLIIGEDDDNDQA